jgi:hypothetical protein
VKLSVSVPDELWDRARAGRPDLSTSHLVQQALERWTSPEGSAGYSLEAPEAAAELMERATARLSEDAREHYERGYLAGAKAGTELDWWSVQSLHDKHYDVRAWIDPIRNGQLAYDMGQLEPGMQPSSAVGPLVEALGALMSPWGDNMFTPSAPYLRGFTQAMRDLWQRVNVGGPEEAAGAGEGDAPGQ